MQSALLLHAVLVYKTQPISGKVAPCNLWGALLTYTECMYKGERACSCMREQKGDIKRIRPFPLSRPFKLQCDSYLLFTCGGAIRSMGSNFLSVELLPARQSWSGLLMRPFLNLILYQKEDCCMKYRVSQV